MTEVPTGCDPAHKNVLIFKKFLKLIDFWTVLVLVKALQIPQCYFWARRYVVSPQQDSAYFFIGCPVLYKAKEDSSLSQNAYTLLVMQELSCCPSLPTLKKNLTQDCLAVVIQHNMSCCNPCLSLILPFHNYALSPCAYRVSPFSKCPQAIIWSVRSEGVPAYKSCCPIFWQQWALLWQVAVLGVSSLPPFLFHSALGDESWRHLPTFPPCGGGVASLP